MKETLVPSQLLKNIDDSIKSLSGYNKYSIKQINRLKKSLISLWMYIYERQKASNVISYDMYVNIGWKELKPFKLIIKGRIIQYSELISLLKEAEVIKINKRYRVDSFTMSYKIDLSFLNTTHFTEVEIDFKKIYRNLKSKEYWLAKYPRHCNIIESSYNVSVDLDSYIYWLRSNIGMALKPKCINGVVQKRKLTPEIAYSSVQKCLKVNFKNLWFKVSDTGRFYSNVVNLPSTAIPFISLFDRQGLTSIDITNCQPLLLATRVNSEEYKKDVCVGTFYDNLSTLTKRDRNWVKLQSFKYIFFNDNLLKSGELYNAMESIYPGVMDQINELKQKEKLWKVLQKLESKIIVERVGISAGLNVITRHDEILCYSENKIEIENLIKDEFAKMNLKVRLK
ncbi:hypothetical protein INR76_06555 [Marixanthomonas sp. SCSIO 43207]|uniref:hypothetical protein n=1 Tax=Marixanthomonas sp. SCSIO 43207 TaxID=2779360 RepID=UPI001CA83E59|nr:hypothetical protein [Marixanthomonas sp. SCSIO 43207]UAB82416.1 hypothetical protein INR76_06555 [Marixanthomonas sp. SCSIO 43207]